ncbi:hypothetical protein CapIbe_017994 [Capra ibex]
MAAARDVSAPPPPPSPLVVRLPPSAVQRQRSPPPRGAPRGAPGAPGSPGPPSGAGCRRCSPPPPPPREPVPLLLTAHGTSLLGPLTSNRVLLRCWDLPGTTPLTSELLLVSLQSQPSHESRCVLTVSPQVPHHHLQWSPHRGYWMGDSSPTTSDSTQSGRSHVQLAPVSSFSDFKVHLYGAHGILLNHRFCSFHLAKLKLSSC